MAKPSRVLRQRCGAEPARAFGLRRGFVEAALGAQQENRALEHLREAVQVKDPLLTAMALQWPGLARLRAGVPEYERVLHTLGWEAAGRSAASPTCAP